MTKVQDLGLKNQFHRFRNGGQPDMAADHVNMDFLELNMNPK